ncbi:class I SAM-dependent methyltransferase [Sporomusa sp.]|uniref:tRNA (adenine(22)-N(1))-methyltransferase n=1 Tax=Sporomusa sp. TaxID=2078658 RepID=UPI002CDF51D7|nr:class I SAM-dependent methyltransferase [Sporomusa sp.]HWR07665.1 class I SAM-dependent methyltransferase [Sporomusa sp.]
MRLGQRLRTIADMVPIGVTMADIGTDHAYLPIYLVEQKIITSAIAGDIHQGPYLSAKNAVAAVQLTQHISVRLGNGLEVVKPGEAEVVVIAGMGGANIIDILNSRPEVTSKVKRLILQPMIAAALVRTWLHTQGWQIVDEQLVQEEGKLYQIIAAEPGGSPVVEPVLYEIGPLLWQSKHPLLKLHINELIGHLRGVILAMEGSADAVKLAKYREYTIRLKALEEKIRCL